MKPFVHDRAVGSRIQIETDSHGNQETVLVVDTNLELDGTQMGYDAERVDDLTSAASEYMRGNPDIDRLVIQGGRRY